MSKRVPIFTDLDTATSTVSVTADAGGSGQLLAITRSSVAVRLYVRKPAADIEFKVGSGAWQVAMATEGDFSHDLTVDLSTTSIYLRKKTSARRAISITVEVDYISGTQTFPAIAPVSGGGIRTRFFASLPNGAAFRTGKCLAAIPDWVSSTVYYQGSVVKNAGGVYYLLGKLSTGSYMASTGVAAVTAPTGTGSAVIATATDNFRWLYLGPYSATLLAPDQSDFPTLSVATVPGALTRRYNTQVAADLAALWVTGSDYVNTGGGGGGVNGIAAVTYPNTFTVDFCTDAPVIAFNKVQNGGGFQYFPVINGTPLGHKCTSGLAAWTAVGNNSNFSYVMDWSTQPQQARRVRLNISGSGSSGVFTGVWVDPRYSVWAPTNPNRYRLYLEGDSITQGAEPGNGQLNRSHRLANMLGCDDVWGSATGSTGFINNGGGSTLITRLPRVVAAAPDILYIPPINNDVGNDGTYNTATRTAAYLAYFAAVRAALPRTIILVGGGYATGASNLLTTSASAWQVEADMAAAVASFNDPLVKFIPTISDPAGRWLFGDGSVSGTGNSTPGNSNFMIGDGSDTLHPNLRFYDWMMQRECTAIIAAMQSVQTA